MNLLVVTNLFPNSQDPLRSTFVEQEVIALINPSVVKKSGERIINEGCLSVPGYFAPVNRAKTVTVKGKDINGKDIRIKASDLMAQALEHEIDHVNGILYIDHLESLDQLQKVEPEQSASGDDNEK